MSLEDIFSKLPVGHTGQIVGWVTGFIILLIYTKYIYQELRN